MAVLPTVASEVREPSSSLVPPCRGPEPGWGSAASTTRSRWPARDRLAPAGVAVFCVLALTAAPVACAPSGARVGAVGGIARPLTGGLLVPRPGNGRRFAGRRDAFGFDDGLEGEGFGLAGGLVGAGLQPPPGGPDGNGPFPPGFPPFGPPLAGSPQPCVRPQVIRIGGGPRRVGVRVVYGAPPPCGP